VRYLPYRRTALWAAVAVVGAVCTFVSFHRYVGWLRAQIPAGGLVTVVAAASDIEAGDTIGREKARTVQVPAETAPNGALHSVGDVAGAVATVFVEEGQILTARIAGRSGASALVPRGMLAYDLPAAFGFSPGLVPRQGDRVDVIAVFPSAQDGEATAVTVLRWRAVAGFTAGGEGAASMSAAPDPAYPADLGDAGAASSGRITLLVTPEEAEHLAMAESTGRVRVVLASALP
jgi:Flp pilus assembly protein CpaB